jgi:uncharacterized protein YndB with AHSA1/START domain
MPDIMHLLRIQATPERVYEAISTASGVREWWTRDAQLEDAVGGEGEFAFYDRQSVTRVVVEELVPAVRVRWKVVSAKAGGWTGTTITFDLRADGDGAVLSFAQRGFVEANEWYARTTTGWAYYLVSLQQYLERGSGAPHPDVDFARVIR